MSKIAVIGFGSLLWDLDDLARKVSGKWKMYAGPVLPLGTTSKLQAASLHYGAGVAPQSMRVSKTGGMGAGTQKCMAARGEPLLIELAVKFVSLSIANVILGTRSQFFRSGG